MADEGPETILNWRRLNERLTTSGQPSEAQLAGLAALGVRTVINLGMHDHDKALPDEAATVAALGMDYVHIPVPFAAPGEEHYRRFREEYEAAERGPLHVHCIANYRVSAFLYRYRRDVLGMDEAAARAEMLDVWTPEGVWAEFVERRMI